MKNCTKKNKRRMMVAILTSRLQLTLFWRCQKSMTVWFHQIPQQGAGQEVLGRRPLRSSPRWPWTPSWVCLSKRRAMSRASLVSALSRNASKCTVSALLKEGSAMTNAAVKTARILKSTRTKLEASARTSAAEILSLLSPRWCKFNSISCLKTRATRSSKRKWMTPNLQRQKIRSRKLELQLLWR